MATKLEKAYIKAAIANPKVAKKVLAVIDWFDTGGGGGGGSGEPSGPLKSIQTHNPNGEFSGYSGFTYNDTTKEMSLGSSFFKGATTTPVTMNDGQSVPQTLINIDATQSKFAIIFYSIERAGQTRTGILNLCHNGTVVTMMDNGTDTGGAGIDGSSIDLSCIKSGDSIFVQYTTDSTGSNANFNYIIMKW